MKCLILEKHVWETGKKGSQIQIPLEAAERFFGAGNRTRFIELKYKLQNSPTQSHRCSVSVIYQNGTRRINGLPIIGELGHCFVFIKETTVSGVYDFWWDFDLAQVASKYSNWQKGRDNQYGRGRLVNIVDN